MQPTQLPYCVQIVQAIGPTAIAAAAIIITGYFAFWQWKATNDKLKIDLFEKRFAIYAATMKVLGNAVQSGNCSNEEIVEFVRSVKGIEFLFDKEIGLYEKEIRKKLNELRSSEHLGPQTEARQVKDYLEEQHNDGAREKFAPYLSFAHLKW
jgi:hypothetical protein